MKTIDAINEECANVLLSLGRSTYQRWLLDEEIGKLNRKAYDLNVEALNLKNAMESAKASLEISKEAGNE